MTHSYLFFKHKTKEKTGGGQIEVVLCSLVGFWNKILPQLILATEFYETLGPDTISVWENETREHKTTSIWEGGG